MEPSGTQISSGNKSVRDCNKIPGSLSFATTASDSSLRPCETTSVSVTTIAPALSGKLRHHCGQSRALRHPPSPLLATVWVPIRYLSLRQDIPGLVSNYARRTRVAGWQQE